MIAKEQRQKIFNRGKPKTRAGFAKIELAVENRENAQSFIDRAIQKNSFVNTDGKSSYHQVKNVNLDYQTTENLEWMPWIHKFISNAKKSKTQIQTQILPFSFTICSLVCRRHLSKN